jgi:translation elongation factor EF-Ts
LGRKRIDEADKVITLSINLQQKVIRELEKEGKPKNVIERIINDKYLLIDMEK